MDTLLDACLDLPAQELEMGAVLVREGQERSALYVLESGTLEVSRAGALVATIADPGAVVGEISMLLDLDYGATVTAAEPSRVRVISDPQAFIDADPERLYAIARTLATRLSRLTAYLIDVRSQYAESGGHLELLDEVLAELTFGNEPPAQPGSARDPEPLY